MNWIDRNKEEATELRYNSSATSHNQQHEKDDFQQMTVLQELRSLIIFASLSTLIIQVQRQGKHIR